MTSGPGAAACRHPCPARRALAAMTMFHVRHLLSIPFFRQTALLTPVGFALLKILTAGWHADASVWFDAAVSGLWATTTTATGIIGFQRFQGTLQYLALGVRPAWTAFMPVVAASALIGVAGLPAALAVTLPFVQDGPGRDLPDRLACWVVGYLLAVLSCCVSAAVLSSLFVLSRHAIAFETLIQTPMWLLCGIVTPIDALPAPVRAIARLFPLTYAVHAAQSGAADASLALEAAGCLALCLVYAAAAALGLRAALSRAMKEGTLDLS